MRLPTLPPFLNVTPNHFDGAIFTDLNDMDAHFAEFDRLLKTQELRYEPVNKKGSIFRNATIDICDPFFQSISFFEFYNQNKLQSLVTYGNCTTDSDKRNQTFRYSMGYAVSPDLRGRGLGLKMVKESLNQLRTFLDSIGPQYDSEPYQGFHFVVDVVIDQNNEPSRALAKHIKPENAELQYGKEQLTDKPVCFFSIPLTR